MANQNPSPPNVSPHADAASGSEARPESAARVLVVDDERGPRESLRMILSGSYSVRVSDNGTDALAQMRETPFDLVTVDLNMPGMKGDELMRAIRAEFPHTEIIIITGCGSLETAVEGLRHGVFDYLTKPFDVVRVSASVERALERRESRARMSRVLDELGQILGQDEERATTPRTLGENVTARERLRRLLEEPAVALGMSHPRSGSPSTTEFLEVLAETIESRDLFMRGHARRVAYYADLLAEALELAPEPRRHVRIAAFLHDIGKVGASAEVLQGVELPDTNVLSVVENHSAIGERLLLPLGLAEPIAQVVRHHHERFDGAGYPDGLAGKAIPLASRIISVCDAFDAMTCDRAYRRARTRDEALIELRREAGGQFDPDLVTIFRELVASGAADGVSEAGTLSEVEETNERADRGAA